MIRLHCKCGRTYPLDPNQDNIECPCGRRHQLNRRTIPRL